MYAFKKSLRRLMNCCASLAALATTTTAASAQDCKLSVQAAPQIIHSGESAGVNVFAHFPAPPALNAPFAFAAASFDMHASDPAWTFASAGAIAGADVMGINVSQPHAPQLGIIADPSNPFRVWHGVFEPQSNAPALVEIAADPISFSVYPSKLTSSSAPRDADGGNDFVLVNPLSVAGWAAAPRAGTRLTAADDVIVDGRVITGEWIGIGLLPTACANPHASSASVSFLGQPVTFTATVQLNDAQRSRIGSMTVTFDGLEGEGGGRRYAGGANFLLGDGSVRTIHFGGFLGGVRVASADLDADDNGQAPAFTVDSLPRTVLARTGTGTLALAAANTYSGATFILEFDRPISATVRGDDGRIRTVTLDRIELDPVRGAASRAGSMNNLKQMTLGCQIFEAAGVQEMSITPGQPE